MSTPTPGTTHDPGGIKLDDDDDEAAEQPNPGDPGPPTRTPRPQTDPLSDPRLPIGPPPSRGI